MTAFVGPLGADLTPESVEVEYQLSGVWSETAQGFPVLLDDGYEWDTLESRITLRLAPSELASFYAIVRSGSKLTLEGDSFALGPDWPLAGQEVDVISWAIDGPADATATLYDVVATIRANGLPAPTGGDLAYVMAHGEAYPTLGMDGNFVPLDGSNAWSPARTESAECKWYSRGLTTDQAAKLVRGWRALRGDAYSWTTPVGMRPFGVPTLPAVSVRIPEMRISRMGRMYWEAELRIVAYPNSLDLPAGYGLRYGLSYGAV